MYAINLLIINYLFNYLLKLFNYLLNIYNYINLYNILIIFLLK